MAMPLGPRTDAISEKRDAADFALTHTEIVEAKSNDGIFCIKFGEQPSSGSPRAKQFRDRLKILDIAVALDVRGSVRSPTAERAASR